MSDVRWLGPSPGGSGGGLLLVSAGNDGLVKLWDAAKQRAAAPKLLQTMEVREGGRHRRRRGRVTD